MSRMCISAAAAAFALALGLGGAGTAAAQEWVPAPCDVVTGGGTLVDDDADLVHLTAEVGCRDGTLVGQVEYRDPRDRIHFRSLAITAWLTDPKRPWLRDACGIAGSGVARVAHCSLVRRYTTQQPVAWGKTFTAALDKYRHAACGLLQTAFRQDPVTP